MEIIAHTITFTVLGLLVAAWLFLMAYILRDMGRAAEAWCERHGLPHPIITAWRLLWVPAWLSMLALRWASLRLLHVMACALALLTIGLTGAVALWHEGAEDWAG